MESLFFHPKIVHIPVALAVLMPLIAAGIWLAWWRGWLPARAWALATVLQLVLVGSGALAMQTGEQDEERVEALVPEAALEAHEHAAEAFVWGGGAVAAIMTAGLVLSRRKAGLPLGALGVAGTLVVLGLGYRTGQAGGALVYQHGAAQAYAAAAPGVEAVVGTPERDDDD